MTYTCWNCGWELKVTDNKDCQDYLIIQLHLEDHLME